MADDNVADPTTEDAGSIGKPEGVEMKEPGDIEVESDDPKPKAVGSKSAAKLGSDGEPTPVGNDAQRRVAQAIADSMKKGSKTLDVNKRIKDITVDEEKKSMAARLKIQGRGEVKPPAKPD